MKKLFKKIGDLFCRRKESFACDGQIDLCSEIIKACYLQVKELPKVDGSMYRWALCSGCAVDDMEDSNHGGVYMDECVDDWLDYLSMDKLKEALTVQLDSIMNAGSDGIRTYMFLYVPTLCYDECGTGFHLAFVKANNNGSSFWLSDNRDVLVALAFVDRMARKNRKK